MKTLCKICGNRFDKHENTGYGFLCPVHPASHQTFFISSGWYDGPPEEPCFYFFIDELGEPCLNSVSNKHYMPKCDMHFPVVTPDLPPIAKGFKE